MVLKFEKKELTKQFLSLMEKQACKNASMKVGPEEKCYMSEEETEVARKILGHLSQLFEKTRPDTLFTKSVKKSIFPRRYFFFQSFLGSVQNDYSEIFRLPRMIFRVCPGWEKLCLVKFLTILWNRDLGPFRFL